MRLIDVCIPHFGEDETQSLPVQPTRNPSTFPLPAAFFGQTEQEYNIDDDDEELHKETDSRSGLEEQFFEAEDGTSDVCVLMPLRFRAFQGPNRLFYHSVLNCTSTSLK